MRLGEKKRRIRRRRRNKKPQDENIMVCSILQGDHNYRPYMIPESHVNIW